MITRHRVAIGLGSNMGDRRRYLQQALARIERLPGFRLLATSQLYESAGWGRDDLAPFLNAVAAGETSMAPDVLLDALLKIERDLGRQRRTRWESRVIDLDVLACDAMVVKTENLTLPHPWIAHRPFVYLPLAEVATCHPAWAALTVPNDAGRACEAESKPVPEATPGWGVVHPGTSERIVASGSEADTEALGRAIAPWLVPGDVVALDAPVGAGKSVLARGIARGLGIADRIQSPTFTLCREYPIPTGGSFQHWDFYRLASVDDLESTGFHDPAATSTAIRAVEWAGCFPEELGAPLLQISLQITGDESREITLKSGRAGAPLPVGLVDRG